MPVANDSVFGILLGKVTGKTMYTVLRPVHKAHDCALRVDPVGVIMLLGTGDAPIASIEMMSNRDIQLQGPQGYVDRLTRYRANPNPPMHAQALDHIQAGAYMPRGQSGIMDTPITEAELAAAQRSVVPKAKAPLPQPGTGRTRGRGQGGPPERRGDDREQQRGHRRQWEG